LTAVYDKLGGIEIATTEALVAHSAAQLRPVLEKFGAIEPWVPGFRVRVLDGNPQLIRGTVVVEPLHGHN
jgi:hypothetical protein